MKATLDALDERLRRLIAQPCGRAARIACAALVLLGFAGVMMTRSLALGHHAATAVMMCLPLAAMLVFAMRIVREHEQGALGALLLGALCAAGMTGIALRLRMNPFRLYAFAGVALGLAAYAATLGRLLRFFAARSARLRANPRECVKKVK